MEKRKSKLNVLDITIIAVLICAVVALVFRGTVKEIFDEPEMVPVIVNITTEKDNPAATEIFKLHNTVYIDGNTPLQAVVVYISETEDELVVTLECMGYKKLGRYYTEHGDLLSNVSECTVQYSDMRVRCSIYNVVLESEYHYTAQ